VIEPSLRPWVTAVAFVGVTFNFVAVWRAHERGRTDVLQRIAASRDAAR
jgi:hypothetical protein